MRDLAAYRERLEDARLLHVDARVIAFHLVGQPRYLPLTRMLLEALGNGSARGQTSALTLYQVLVEPYRRGAGARAAGLERHLSVLPGLELVPLTREIAAQAAQVRAQLGGRVERAVQIATGLSSGADLFLTEGSGLKRIAGMVVLNLDDYV